jgi:hypothetical protein
VCKSSTPSIGSWMGSSTVEKYSPFAKEKELIPTVASD